MVSSSSSLDARPKRRAIARTGRDDDIRPGAGELGPRSSKMRPSFHRMGSQAMDATQGLGPTDSDPVGRRIDHFQVLQLLGEGGMGQVYKALDLELRRVVAVKTVAPPGARRVQFRLRFEREAQALSAVNHPNVAQIYSSGSWGGRPYYAMEYIEGHSLALVLAEGRRLSGRRCLDYLIEAARGLEAAFDKGIIHRDVKPANLMIDASRHLKVVDFGLARRIHEDSSLTRTDRPLGTPRYMSPEQAQGREADHRSDIYSLGATFYHLFAGVPPFAAETPVATLLEHVGTPLPPLRERNPRVPPAVAAIVERMLAKDPGERYASYAELISDLERARAGRRVLQRATRTRTAPPEPPGRGSGERRVPPWSILAVALALGLALGLVLAPRGAPSPEGGSTGTAAPPGPGAPDGAPVGVDERTEPGHRASPGPGGEARDPPRRPPGLGPSLLDPRRALRQTLALRTNMAMRRVAVSLEAYLAGHEQLPPDLVTAMRELGLGPGDLLDGWGNELRYDRRSSYSFRLISAGPDGAFATEDDLVLEDGTFAPGPAAPSGG